MKKDRNRLLGIFILLLGLFIALVGISKEKPIKSLVFSRPIEIWANNGEDKVTRDELRAARGKDVTNSIWDGERIRLFGARNEVIAFNLIIEAPRRDLQDVHIIFDHLENDSGQTISSKKVPKNNVFDFVDRNIELFYIRYLQIKGLTRLLYRPEYDERHVPEKLRLPYKLPKGKSRGRFENRPNANKFYPDIAVPIEAVGAFDIKKENNQSIWIDIYIPKDLDQGFYKGILTVKSATEKDVSIPVQLEVLNFALPDLPHAKTMLYYQDEDIRDRYYGERWPNWSKVSKQDKKRLDRIWLNHHKVAHRHKISLIDPGMGIEPSNTDERFDDHTKKWVDVLSGDAFSQKNGYDGPGKASTSNVYSIGTYGAWRRQWNEDNKRDLWLLSNLWVEWFKRYAPKVEYFLYLLDEPRSKSFDDVERWAHWIDENPEQGKRLRTLATSLLPRVEKHMPSVDIAFTGWGDADVFGPIVKNYQREGKDYWAYNGWRPSTGSFAIEDDGVALRVVGWTQFKHKIARWFYWHSTSYRNPSHANHETNVFESAWTFGRKWDKRHAKYGETGSDYSNGDGVLFYPGTEKRFRREDYGLDGPIASLRLKHWRRGIQDVDYLTMAAKIDPQGVKEIVNEMIPKVLWEVGVTDPKDPSYVHADISWSTDPDVWEEARRELAEIVLKED